MLFPEVNAFNQRYRRSTCPWILLTQIEKSLNVFAKSSGRCCPIPLNPDYTRGYYKVEDLGDGRSKFIFELEFVSKPAWMGGMMNGQFKKLIGDYLLAIEHYAMTGEEVTRENFKKIKKQYRS